MKAVPPSAPGLELPRFALGGGGRSFPDANARVLFAWKVRGDQRACHGAPVLLKGELGGDSGTRGVLRGRAPQTPKGRPPGARRQAEPARPNPFRARAAQPGTASLHLVDGVGRAWV